MVGDLAESVGYVLKQAASALRTAMSTDLRSQGLTVSQYACLELLGQHPGLSNADLARGAFVTRQAMNGVLRGLQERGLITRPVSAPHGRARPAELTAAGQQQLQAASVTVHAVEQRRLARLTSPQQRRLQSDLMVCAAALDPSSALGAELPA